MAVFMILFFFFLELLQAAFNIQHILPFNPKG